MKTINLFLSLVTLLFCVSCKQKKVASFSVLAYNVENLFDTEDDPKTYDQDFTPEGKLKWDKTRYQKKLKQISRVLEIKQLPDIVGLSEVENKTVLQDLAAQPSVKEAAYKIVHADGIDGRGIDVALLYKPATFSLLGQEFLRVKHDTIKRMRTRDILYAYGVAGQQDTLHIFVNHWNSRWGGEAKSRHKRVAAALVLRKKVDQIFEQSPAAKIIIVGDFNDEPDNQSLNVALRATDNTTPKDPTELYNLMWPLDKKQEGSYYYKGKFNMLDNIVVSQALLQNKGLHCTHNSGQIVRHAELLHELKNGTKIPSRTYLGRKNYAGGTSDHLPVFVTLVN